MQEKELINKLRKLQRDNRIEEAENLISENPVIKSTKTPVLKILLAIIYFLSEKTDKAEDIFQQITPEELKDEESLSDYALFMFLMRRIDEAESFLKKALELNPACFIAHARLSAIYLLKNDLSAAEKHLSKALEIEPTKVELLYNLSTLRFKQGKYNEAIELLDRILNIDPERKEAYIKKASVMQAIEKAEDYTEELYERLRKEPDNKMVYIVLSYVLLNTGKEEEAFSIINAALDRFEQDEEVREAFIDICIQAERFFPLGVKLKEWVDRMPDSDNLRFLLNEARIKCNFLEAAENDLEKMPDNMKKDPRWKLLKARLLNERNQADEAIRLLEEVVKEFSGHIEARRELAHLLLYVGRKEEAKEHLEALSKISPSFRTQLMQYKDYEPDEKEIRELENTINNPSLNIYSRISLAFTLAEVYERKGDYENSFRMAMLANELTRSIVKYDWREHRRLIQRIIKAFDKDTIKRLEGKGHKSKRPIFIVGMPRSGTTLLEQILASHSQVYGAGELPWVGKITHLFPRTNGGYPYPEGIRHMDERHLKSAAEYYLEKLNIYNKTAPRVTDKLPHNFDHIGLIYLMFPEAKILHIHRDPRDVAISNFYQNFAAMRGTMGFANDLRDIGHMLKDYMKIMEHWYEVIPEGKIFKVIYEELISDPERSIKEVLDFCELPWEAQVLKFYETRRPVKTASIHQVREGIYQSSKQRWRRYEKFLTPLLEVLEQDFVWIEE